MDIEKLIDQMKWCAEECDRTNFGCQAKKTLQEATDALSALQAENERLRGELERMKKIMRENGIMVIPSKYPGGPAEWNTPKP